MVDYISNLFKNMFSGIIGKEENLDKSLSDFKSRINNITTQLLNPYINPSSYKNDDPRSQFINMLSLLDPAKCKEYALSLAANLNKYYNKLQLEQFANTVLVGRSSNINTNNIHNKNDKTVSKHDLCQAIAIHYVKILNLIAAILTAVNPNENISLNRLKHLLQIVDTTKNTGISMICDPNSDPVKDSILEEPGMREFLMLYYFSIVEDIETEEERSNVEKQFAVMVRKFASIVRKTSTYNNNTYNNISTNTSTNTNTKNRNNRNNRYNNNSKNIKTNNTELLQNIKNSLNNLSSKQSSNSENTRSKITNLVSQVKSVENSVRDMKFTIEQQKDIDNITKLAKEQQNNITPTTISNNLSSSINNLSTPINTTQNNTTTIPNNSNTDALLNMMDKNNSIKVNNNINTSSLYNNSKLGGDIGENIPTPVEVNTPTPPTTNTSTLPTTNTSILTNSTKNNLLQVGGNNTNKKNNSKNNLIQDNYTVPNTTSNATDVNINNTLNNLQSNNITSPINNTPTNNIKTNNNEPIYINDEVNNKNTITTNKLLLDDNNDDIDKFLQFVNKFNEHNIIDPEKMKFIETAFKKYYQYDPSNNTDKPYYINKDKFENMCKLNANAENQLHIDITDPNFSQFIAKYDELKDFYIKTCDDLLVILENKLLDVVDDETSNLSDKNPQTLPLIKNITIANLSYNSLTELELDIRNIIVDLYTKSHQYYQEGVALLYNALTNIKV